MAKRVMALPRSSSSPAPSCYPHGAHRRPTPETTPSPAATPGTPTSPTSSTACAPTPVFSPPLKQGSRLSPLAAPFVPAGRSKFLRWRDDSPAVEDGEPPAPFYRDVLAGAVPVRAPRLDVLPARARADGQRRPPSPVRQRSSAPSRHRHPSARPAPPRRPAGPDGDGWQKVLTRKERRRRSSSATRRTVSPVPDELRDKCFNCLARDHRRAHCRSPTRCYRCHETGHMTYSCSRPRRSPEGAAPVGHDQPPMKRPRLAGRPSPNPAPASPRRVLPVVAHSVAPEAHGAAGNSRRPRRRRSPSSRSSAGEVEPAAPLRSSRDGAPQDTGAPVVTGGSSSTGLA
ncbi:serine/arginine repetitive matrix protein 1-like [Panicum virgatum]|uniref:CCHC-type domain-containing protein n=1 Tax=Panicum virgatum TaxID=38727 RepID=A0A8T0V3K8_PANVG|nr:serine/arginine repetitive matrix protein 1-like [Panicum virgatum]XP_039793228.1 serine/arginine repetitive matrix protein 1-like [Panicum virgatum]KAG2631281.1 hypothetical protein PVAP13_2NG012000 [Panicum virgatum]